MSKPDTLSDEPSFQTTLYVRDHCLCLAAQRTARALARHFDAALRPLGLTNGQFSLLMALNRPTPPPMNALATLLAMDRTTLTAALKPLVRRGLASVTKDPQDKRNRVPDLTPEGHRLLGEALIIWRTTHAEIDAGLTGTVDAGLRTGLARVTEMLA